LWAFGGGFGTISKRALGRGISAIYDNAGQIAGIEIDWPAVRGQVG